MLLEWLQIASRCPGFEVGVQPCTSLSYGSSAELVMDDPRDPEQAGPIEVPALFLPGEVVHEFLEGGPYVVHGGADFNGCGEVRQKALRVEPVQLTGHEGHVLV